MTFMLHLFYHNLEIDYSNKKEKEEKNPEILNERMLLVWRIFLPLCPDITQCPTFKPQ